MRYDKESFDTVGIYAGTLIALHKNSSRRAPATCSTRIRRARWAGSGHGD